MRELVRGLRPSPALILAFAALFVALGGVGYAALNGKDKKKVRGISDQEIAKQAPGLSVANAAKLGGAPASDFQRFCRAGSIKASLVIDTTGLAVSPNFTNEPGFNCFQPGNLTSSVQIRKAALGTYIVRFVGNSGPNNSGSAVISNLDTGYSVAFAGTDLGAPGEVTFTVNTHNDGGALGDNHTFSLLAF
jgi:hypothetical protein